VIAPTRREKTHAGQKGDRSLFSDCLAARPVSVSGKRTRMNMRSGLSQLTAIWEYGFQCAASQSEGIGGCGSFVDMLSKCCSATDDIAHLVHVAVADRGLLITQLLRYGHGGQTSQRSRDSVWKAAK